MKPQAPRTSSWLLLVYIWMLASIARVQVVAAEADPLQGPLRSDDPHHLNGVLKGDLKASLPKEKKRLASDLEFNEIADIDDDDESHEAKDFDDIEDDFEGGLYARDAIENDEMTEEDLQDIREAKIAMLTLMREAGTRTLTNVAPGSTTDMVAGDQYIIYSHDDFGVERYPNFVSRKWKFKTNPEVASVVVYCPFFRIQWSKRCRRDKFGVFKGPKFSRGIRRCGQIHGFWKRYYTSIKIVFKTNAIVRRAGFICAVRAIEYPPTTTTSTSTTSTTTFMPGCAKKPAEWDPKVVVNSCADVLPGYACTCDPIDPGLCLKCEICDACDFEFFAVHDFSAVQLYVLIHYTCPENPIDATKLTYGYEDYVHGYVQCFPSPSHVILPTYPNSEVTFLTLCPVVIDICAALEQSANRRLWTGNALEGPSSPVLASTRWNEIEKPLQRNLASLASLTQYDTNIHIFGIAVDLATLSFPENIRVLDVQDSTGEMFPDGFNVDLSAFTSLEQLTLGLQLTELPSESVIINSANITSITINLPNAVAADIADDAIKYDTTPSGDVTVQITL